MTGPAPGPAPDQAAAELAEAERKLRSVFEGRTAFDTMSWRDVGLVLAELDRLRARIAALLAACSEADAVAGWNTARVTVAEIRALLEGERR